MMSSVEIFLSRFMTSVEKVFRSIICVYMKETLSSVVRVGRAESATV
jgi:hypothetical protein